MAAAGPRRAVGAAGTAADAEPHHRDGRRAVLAGLASLGLLAILGALGDSAAVPGLGRTARHPPWDLAAGAPAALVTVLAALGYLLGGAAVWWGLRAVRRGERLPDPRRLVTAGVVAAFALTLVPPVGSADHLSYLAYGRIAAAGDDAYLEPPGAWRGGTDPVAGAVQPPWQDTPSVYGPLATGVFAAVTMVGVGLGDRLGEPLRMSVWVWSLVCALAFLAVALALDRRHRDDGARRRAAVLWTVNPVLLGQLVLGAHVDVLAAALAVGALVLTARRPAMAGLLLGAAASIKAPYAVFGLAALWGLLHANAAGGRAIAARARSVAIGALAALAVAVPAHLLAGPHVLDQLGRASGFTSIASPWRPLVNLVELATGSGSLRPVVVPASLLVAAVLAWLLGRRILCAATVFVDPGERADGEVPSRRSAWSPPGRRWSWVPRGCCVPPTPCRGTTRCSGRRWRWSPRCHSPSWPVLENAALARLVVLALAYLPGRVVGLTPVLTDLTLGARRYVAPVLVLAAVIVVVRWARRRPSPNRPRAAPAG